MKHALKEAAQAFALTVLLIAAFFLILLFVLDAHAATPHKKAAPKPSPTPVCQHHGPITICVWDACPTPAPTVTP